MSWRWPHRHDLDVQIQRPGEAKPIVVSIVVKASETTGFTHINQLAQLVDQKLAAALVVRDIIAARLEQLEHSAAPLPAKAA